MLTSMLMILSGVVMISSAIPYIVEIITAIAYPLYLFIINLMIVAVILGRSQSLNQKRAP